MQAGKIICSIFASALEGQSRVDVITRNPKNVSNVCILLFLSGYVTNSLYWTWIQENIDIYFLMIIAQSIVKWQSIQDKEELQFEVINS